MSQKAELELKLNEWIAGDQEDRKQSPRQKKSVYKEIEKKSDSSDECEVICDKVGLWKSKDFKLY